MAPNISVAILCETKELLSAHVNVSTCYWVGRNRGSEQGQWRFVTAVWKLASAGRETQPLVSSAEKYLPFIVNFIETVLGNEQRGSAGGWWHWNSAAENWGFSGAALEGGGYVENTRDSPFGVCPFTPQMLQVSLTTQVESCIRRD